VLFCFERWLKKALLQLLKRICIVLLLFQKMAGYGAAVAAKDGAVAATKDGWLYAVVADKKKLLLSKMAGKGAIVAVKERLCCYQRGLAMAMLSSKNSAAPFGNGAVAAARDG
jgi:hypothetical protein